MESARIYGIYGEKGEKKGEKRKNFVAPLYGTAIFETDKRAKQRMQCKVVRDNNPRV